MSTEETEQQQHRSTSATTDEKVENGVEHTIIDIGDVECEGDQRGAYAKNIENEQKKNILERTIDENGDKEENLKKKTTEELNNGNSDTNNDNKKKKEEENDDTDYDDKKKKEIRDSINENAPCISVTNVGKSNSESPLVKPSEEKEENDKKNIKNTKVVTDAEAALKAVNEYNANEMFKHQFEQYKTDILDKLTELRQKVQLLNKANKSIVMMELVSFYTNVKEMKNPYILQAIISPYIAIHLLYHYKMIMLDHSFIEENQQIFDVFTNEQMQIMMYDIVKTIYGNGKKYCAHVCQTNECDQIFS